MIVCGLFLGLPGIEDSEGLCYVCVWEVTFARSLMMISMNYDMERGAERLERTDRKPQKSGTGSLGLDWWQHWK